MTEKTAEKIAAEQAEATRIAAEQAEAERVSKLSQAEKDSEMITKLVKEKVDAELKGIKDKLDGAYAAKEKAEKELEKIAEEKRQAELKRLEEEGKHKEVFEIKLAEEKVKREAAEKKAIELTRDVSVRDALKSFSFRNDNAADIAFREVVTQLVQDSNGNWVHRSGVSIKDFAKLYSDDENNSFLFKAKSNSGGGSNDQTGDTKNDQNGKSKSLFAKTQAEVLAMAERGQLPNQK